MRLFLPALAFVEDAWGCRLQGGGEPANAAAVRFTDTDQAIARVIAAAGLLLGVTAAVVHLG